jgi:hypothetical protein
MIGGRVVEEKSVVLLCTSDDERCVTVDDERVAVAR